MSSLNQVTIIGRLGQDPELRYTKSGMAVCNLSLATNMNWIDKKGEKQQKTEWHRVIVWDKQAENCDQYLTKGRQIYVVGQLQTREWEDKDGVIRYTTEIVAFNVGFLGSKSDDDNQGRQQNQNQNRNQNKNQTHQGSQQQKTDNRKQESSLRKNDNQQQKKSDPYQYDHDDIPF